MKKLFDWIIYPPVTGSSSIVVLRLMAGSVFFFEGILKFVYTNQGVGRFTKLGFPMPETVAHFVAVSEILGGLLLIFGLFTRATAIFFVAEMIVAILSTKVSLYLGTSPLPLPPVPPKTGFWAVEHESRSDIAQLLTCFFLVLKGAGVTSLDFWLRKRKTTYFESSSLQEISLASAPQ